MFPAFVFRALSPYGNARHHPTARPTIKKGDKACSGMLSSNREESLYGRSDRFDSPPEASTRPSAPAGATSGPGHRTCRLGLKVLFERKLRLYPEMRSRTSPATSNRAFSPDEDLPCGSSA